MLSFGMYTNTSDCVMYVVCSKCSAFVTLLQIEQQPISVGALEDAYCRGVLQKEYIVTMETFSPASSGLLGPQ